MVLSLVLKFNQLQRTIGSGQIFSTIHFLTCVVTADKIDSRLIVTLFQDLEWS